MTNKEIVEFQRKDREWRKDPLGAAFTKMTSAMSRAWVYDTESGFRENASDKRLRELWDAERAATQEFRDMLDALRRQHAEMLARVEALEVSLHEARKVLDNIDIADVLPAIGIIDTALAAASEG